MQCLTFDICKFSFDLKFQTDKLSEFNIILLQLKFNGRFLSYKVQNVRIKPKSLKTPGKRFHLNALRLNVKYFRTLSLYTTVVTNHLNA